MYVFFNGGKTPFRRRSIDLLLDARAEHSDARKVIQEMRTVHRPETMSVTAGLEEIRSGRPFDNDKDHNNEKTPNKLNPCQPLRACHARVTFDVGQAVKLSCNSSFPADNVEICNWRGCKGGRTNQITARTGRSPRSAPRSPSGHLATETPLRLNERQVELLNYFLAPY